VIFRGWLRALQYFALHKHGTCAWQKWRAVLDGRESAMIVRASVSQIRVPDMPDRPEAFASAAGSYDGAFGAGGLSHT
jgi:hypothetical protein